jgi:hypothetical protein
MGSLCIRGLSAIWSTMLKMYQKHLKIKENINLCVLLQNEDMLD